MIEKRAEYSLINVQALNNPDFAESFIRKQELDIHKDSFKQTIEKIAASSKESSEKTGDGAEADLFDLESEIKGHPDSLFIKCFAIKADETNDNGDFFSKEQLKEATKTFIGVPLFTNHANSDINEARGKVVYSWWDEDQNGIMIIGRVDAAAYPQLARGIREEYVVGTSMGCQVQYSLCSICHNYAETPDQYCGCIRERKTRQVTARNQICKYHEQGNDKECPLCGSKKSENKKYSVNSKVFEYNFGIKFIENSFVVNPACSTCGITEVIDPQKFLAKVAEIEKTLPRLIKAIQSQPLTCTDQTCIKIAGQKEIDQLNQALDLMSSVSQIMLQQKDQIDLEFLSDLVKVVADLQGTIDELTEQGYGRLPSVDETAPGEPGAEAPGGLPGVPGVPGVPGENPEAQGPPGEVTRSVNPTPGGGSKVQSGSAGAVGNVTGPLAKKKLLNLEKIAEKILIKNKKLVLNEKIILKKVAFCENIEIIEPKKIDLSFSIKQKSPPTANK